jgi:hypothetical protein
MGQSGVFLPLVDGGLRARQAAADPWRHALLRRGSMTVPVAHGRIPA